MNNLNLKSLLVSIILLFASFYTSAKNFIPGNITYQDGKIEEGYVKKFFAHDNKIHFRKSREGVVKRIKSEKLSEIILILETDTLVFRNHYLARFGNRNKLRYSDLNCWAIKYYESPQVEAYIYNYNETSGPFIGPSAALVYITNAVKTAIDVLFDGSSQMFAIRFPDMDAIVAVDELEGKEPKNLQRFSRKLKKVLEKNCHAFRIANKKENRILGKDIWPYLDYYSEVCK